TFGDERKLSDNVNIAGNNNFPFVMGDGVTVYYGSTGDGSLGGYDIFATRYNINNDSYLNPEPLGMPFNSPANDYMYVVDETKGLGWFVTDRNQPEGKVAIYLFIPNQSRRTVQSDDEAYLRNRAMISSIAESWKEGEDYSELVKLAYESAGSNKQKKDFEFVINDNIVYFTSDDFSSPKALELFEKAQSARMQVAELERSLAELRKKYTEGNNSDKKQLQPAILRLESQLEEMQNTPDQLEKEARNAEIMLLRKNQ
ncbi:MAG: tetratricopeptide repeat protein, partial [Tannerellaceae bacterium]